MEVEVESPERRRTHGSKNENPVILRLKDVPSLSPSRVSTGERQEWVEALQKAARPPACRSQKRGDSLTRPAPTSKRGPLELRGHKGRVLVSLEGSRVRLCKTEQVLPGAAPGTARSARRLLPVFPS